jgi:hypothetical protein
MRRAMILAATCITLFSTADAASAQSFALAPQATGLYASYGNYASSGESYVSKLSGGIFLFGIITTGIGAYELARPEPDYRQDGKTELAIGLGGVAVSLVLAKLADDYERKHPEKIYHSHYRSHDRFFRTSKGYFRYSAINTDGQMILACSF